LGSPRIVCLAPLSKRRRTNFSIRRSPGPIKDRAHPSSRNSSSEFLRSISSPFIFRCSASPALGFPSLFATSLERGYDSSRRIPRTASIRPQVFATSRRLLPLSSLQAYFIPQPRPGSDFVQGLLSRRSHPSSSEGAASLPLLHRRSYTRSDFHRFACRPRATPLGFEASICAGPRSLSPVIHLAQSRSPLRISRSSRILALSTSASALTVAFRSMLRVRSLSLARTFRWTRSPITFEVSPLHALSRKHGRDPRAGLQAITVLFRSPDHFAKLVLRALHILRGSVADTTSSVTAVAGLACFAGSSPFGCFELGGAFARSPCGDSSVRSRLLGFSAPSVAVSQPGALFRMRCLPSHEGSRVSDHFALVEAAHDRISHLSIREIVQRPCTPCFSCLRTCSPALRRSSPHADMFARDEDANSRVHPHLATRSSCFHVEVVAAFHVRARCTIRLSTVMHVEARGCASCFSLLGARDLQLPSFDGSEFRVRSSVPAVARSLLAAALMFASRRS